MQSFVSPDSLMLQSSKLLGTIKGALSGLRQFLATEKPLKMMKNAFYFTLKALFVLKIFRFCLECLIM